MAPCIKRDAEAGGLSVSNKKRKYSPIVWDRDDKVCKLSSYTGISSRKHSTNTFLSTGSFSVSTGVRQSGPPVKSVVDVVSGLCGTDGMSSPFEGKYGGHKKVEYEDCAQLHEIGSCRWVDDVEDGEITDSPADTGMKLDTGEMGVSKKLSSPQFEREGSEGRSSGSSDKGSNRSSLTDECDMEIVDQHNYGDSSVGHLNTDTDVECGFWETPEPAVPLQRSVNMLQACRSVDDPNLNFWITTAEMALNRFQPAINVLHGSFFPTIIFFILILINNPQKFRASCDISFLCAYP